MSTKLLVLGVDAASPALIERWAAQGKLPALRSLMDRGRFGTVLGVEGLYVGSTWPSFSMGLNPANHGFYRIEQLRSGTYEFFRPLQTDEGPFGIPFWQRASEAGRRVAVLDVPLSRRQPLNGIQTVEWGGHDVVYGFDAWPAELAGDILTGVGPYPLPSSCDADRSTAADFEAWVGGLERAVQMKTDLTLDLLGRESWDLFMQVFTEAHCVGHQCWHIHDPLHPSHAPALLEAVGDPLERVYRAIDRGIQRIVASAGDATLLVMSAHGMSHFRTAQPVLPEILFRLGVTAEPPRPPPRPRTIRTMANVAAARVWRALPEAARGALRPVRERYGPPVREPTFRIRADLRRSRCFPIPNGFPVAGIRLNLVGREPFGILHPGPETDAFVQDLTSDLLDIVDERTGRPLIARVHTTADLFSGTRGDALPDLLVEWARTPATGTDAHAGGRGARVRATSPQIGTVEGRNRWRRTGEHTPAGMYVYVGPGVAPVEERQSVSVLDVHPTLCRLMGLPEPDVDGVVIPGWIPRGA